MCGRVGLGVRAQVGSEMADSEPNLALRWKEFIGGPRQLVEEEEREWSKKKGEKGKRAINCNKGGKRRSSKFPNDQLYNTWHTANHTNNY